MAPISVVKVGTSSIAKESGDLDDDALTKLAADVAAGPSDLAETAQPGHGPAHLGRVQARDEYAAAFLEEPPRGGQADAAATPADQDPLVR